jgi:hypoxanthine phosphoribosyltransferase
MAKRYINAEQFSVLSFGLGKLVFNSGFKPTFIVALWRGGATVGINVQEFLKWKGVNPDHIAIRTSSYEGQTQNKEIRVHGLEYIVKHANVDDNLLIVDDVFDTGRSIAAVLDKIKRKMRNNTPKNIKVATVFYKPENVKVDIRPDYYVEVTGEWLVFPHEIEGMSIDEIKQHKGDFVASLLE